MNSAEAFLTHLRDNKVKSFKNYGLLKTSYEWWCSDNGLVPLGITNLKRVMVNNALAEPASYRDPDTGETQRGYFIDGADPKKKMVSIGNGMQVDLDNEPKPKPTAKQGQLGEDW